MTSAHIFRLLGTGSSGGVPRIGNVWGDCNPYEPRNRRTRCCALVTRRAEQGKTRVLIDTSPDIRNQLLAACVNHLDAIVYTHDHADQTHGIDDVRALALKVGKAIPTYMDKTTRQSLVNKFRYCFEGKGIYPAILDLQAPLKIGHEIRVDGVGGEIGLLPLDQEHGPIRSLGFRIGSLAYCNDVSALPADTSRQLKGVDILILDALRRSPHPTHAHLEQALEWARDIGARRTVLTNMHVDLDYQTLRAELPAGVEPGYDGMEIAFDG